MYLRRGGIYGSLKKTTKILNYEDTRKGKTKNEYAATYALTHTDTQLA